MEVDIIIHHLPSDYTWYTIEARCFAIYYTFLSTTKSDLMEHKNRFKCLT